ncbi:MAG: DUF4905 domain-containing protein [Ignavibacteriales bacterium]|nr:DUF4905 domain-containing protein [Ignavibacteriales bacterium]
MKLFSFFSSQLKPAWSYSTTHTLWRVIFSHNGIIVCEERDTDEKIVFYSCIEAATGKIVWSNRSFNEQWWIGIEGITNDRLYLHGFKKPDMPEHLGIIAVDLKSGNELWRSMQSSFLTDDNGFVYGFKDLFERRVFHKIDRTTGTFIEQLETLPAEVESNTQLEKTDFTFPSPCSSNDDIVSNAFSLLHIDGNKVKSAECVHSDKYLIINMYTDLENAGEMRNSLSVIDTTTQKKVYSEVLNGSTPYPVPDSFFVDGQRVYFIKERKTFVALNLP